MPGGHHRKPFSNKQKKEQLQAKREKKRNVAKDDTSSSNEPDNKDEEHVNRNEDLVNSFKLLNQQPIKSDQAYNPNRFNLKFLKESPDQLKKQKKNACKPLELKSEFDCEIDINDVYKPSSSLDMPLRPHWSYEMTKEQLEKQERDYFAEYLEKIFNQYKHEQLSFFEMNLETWRQLWRVMEISDIILLIVDIRFPALHFSPAFYDACTKTFEKDVILVLNKIDLVASSVVAAWKNYFTTKFPRLRILLFSSSKQIKHRRFNKKHTEKASSAAKENVENETYDQVAVRSMAAEVHMARAHRQLYECVKEISGSQVDLISWDRLTQSNLDKLSGLFVQDNKDNNAKQSYNYELTSEDAAQMNELIYSTKAMARKKFEHGFVTIGCCGFPNVGKSSLLNSLNGRKVVSVSRTPGHTKHLQTIFLTKSVRFCDCPGLVFPSLINKQLQILAGIYPIAQLQEPYSSIRYLAERIDMKTILKLDQHPSSSSKEEEKEYRWTPLDICEAWAIKRGYYTAKASRPDVYRAANELLRMALDGRLCLSLKPIGYHANLIAWSSDAETKRLEEINFEVETICKKNALAYRTGSMSDRRDLSNIDSELNSQGADGDDENESDDSEKEDEYYGKDPLESVSEPEDETKSTLVSNLTNKFSLLNENENN